jgi:periplasmic divalent cation tolerance protein
MSKSDVSVFEVVTRCSDADALRAIATALVSERLAACTHVRGPVESTYRWRGTVERALEWELDAVSTGRTLEGVQQRIVELHPYETPTVIIRRVVSSDAYRSWVEAETTPAAF